MTFIWELVLNSVAWVDQTPAFHPSSFITSVCIQTHSCHMWDPHSRPPLWPVDCLKNLLDQSVPLKPSLCQGPMTCFPTTIWKPSGQICNCLMALLHAVVILFVPAGHWVRILPNHHDHKIVFFFHMIVLITLTPLPNRPDCVYPWQSGVVVSWSTLVWMNQFKYWNASAADPEPWVALIACSLSFLRTFSWRVQPAHAHPGGINTPVCLCSHLLWGSPIGCTQCKARGQGICGWGPYKEQVEKHGVTQRSRQKMFSSTGVTVLIKETRALLGKEGEYQ